MITDHNFLMELIKKLQSENSDDRAYAASILMDAYPAISDPALAPAIIEPLIQALSDPNLHVRSYTACALCLAQPNNKEWLELAVHWAKNGDATVRADCSRFLGDILKTHDQGAVRVLMDNLANDPEPEVRAQSAFALGQIVPASIPAIPVLTQALKDSSPEVRLEAAIAFSYFGPLAKDAILGLQECIKEEMDNPYPDLRWQAIQALGEIGPESFLFLLNLLNDHEEGARFQAARGLSKMGSHILPGLEELIKALEDEHSGVVCSIFDCLGNLGKAAQRAVSKIKKAMASFPDNGSVQKAGNEALAKIAGGPENHIV